MLSNSKIITAALWLVLLVSTATTQAGTELYFVHGDHLGTAKVITNQNQDVVWQADYTPFGEVVETSNQTEYRQRFPGQYQDDETGFYYNYYRDYDPSLGRYIQSDPIGLNGGLNTYAYVGGNPIRYIDPTGEVALNTGTGALAGSAFGPVGTVVGAAVGTVAFVGSAAWAAWQVHQAINGASGSGASSAIGSGTAGGTANCPPNDPFCQNQGQSQNQCPSPKSTKSWGHSFSRHGAGSKITNKLTGRAAGTGQAQGQWLNNQQAAQHIHNLNLSGNATIRIPSGLGQVIKPNGAIVSAHWARVVLSPNGVRTAFPILP